jgi:hypothetical protein
VHWKHLSSVNGDLPVPPGGSKIQTGVVVGDFDGNGTNDFVLSFQPYTWETPRVDIWLNMGASQ